MAVPLLILIILFQIIKHFALISFIKKGRVVAVPLLNLIILFQNMNHSLPEYESFYFDLSIDPLPPAERSDSLYHEEFADELAHIISPPEYDRFCFKIEEDDCCEIDILRRELKNTSFGVLDIFWFIFCVLRV
ncbi:hypothetical protein Tco_0644494 [Tanacetum coccineum]